MSENNKCFYTDELIQSASTFIEAIREARNEAIKRGIEANTIIINDRLAYVQGFDFCESGMFPTINHFPPMILGMEAYIAPPTEMPSGAGFIVTHKDATAIDAIRREAKDELIKELKEMPLRDVLFKLYSDEIEDY